MKHLLATVALGPLLLLQGRWVRRVTPVLPEAPGPREGRAGEGPPLRLLILGDSAAAGVGAPAQAEALAGQLASRLAPRFDLRWTLVARTGDTTRDALQTLATMPGERFDVVVTSLGVNDVTSGRSPTRWMADQASSLRCWNACTCSMRAAAQAVGVFSALCATSSATLRSVS